MAKKKTKKKRKGRSAAFMRSINPYLKSRSTKRGRRMAKKRYKKTRSKKSRSVLGINTAAALGAVVYGAGRQKVSNYIAPYTSKIPLGNISDEVAMLAIATLGKKMVFKSKGVIRDALTAGQVIELARIGEAAINGEINLGGGASSTTQAGYIFY